MSITTKKFGARVGIGLTSSLVALTSALATHNTLAQEKSEAEEDSDSAPVVQEQIVVTGTRGSLQNAQEIKRNADTFVDAISATDIGALPDRSVLEAMQRVPGISIERFAGKNDPDHFSVEGSGAVVRGMTQTRSEFNGRDSFTANSGRGLSFQDVPPELMGSVKVFKNQTADMIEGGIAGTISLYTRLPFDQDGRKVSVSADVTYGDILEKATPTVSGLFSDRWDTNLGEIGLLLNASYSHLEASSHGIQTDRYEFRPLTPEPAPGLDDFDYVTTPYTYDGSFLDAREGTEVGDLGVLVPNGSNLTMKNDTRYRRGFAAAIQWADHDETMQATVQFLRSDARLAWTENALKYQTGFNTVDHFTLPAAGGEYEFDDNGVFTNGTLTDVATGWRGDGDRIPHNASWTAEELRVYNFGHRFQADNRYKDQNTVVDDLAFNFKWTPDENWEFELDLQNIMAETRDDDVTLMHMTHAIQDYSIPSGGGTPSLVVWNPWHLASEDNIAAHAADGNDWASSNYFNQLSSYNYNAAMDHYERSNGESNAIRIDGTRFFDSNLITKISAGFRHAKREQIVRNSGYNWGSLAPIWQDNGVYLDMVNRRAVAADGSSVLRSQVIDWSEFYRGDVLTIEGGNTIIHPSDEITQDYKNWGYYFAPFIDSQNCGDWRPTDARIDVEDFITDELGNEICLNTPLDDLNGYFRDREIINSTEENTAAYVRVDFEFDAAIRFAGNIGLRGVTMETSSAGNTIYPSLLPSYRAPSGFNPETFDPHDRDLYPNPATDLPYDLLDDSSRFLGDVANYISADLSGFANNIAVEQYAEQRYTKYLPSLNIKAEITDDLIARFAVSKAIALPDIGNMRNQTEIGIVGDNVQFSLLEPIYTIDNPHPDAPPGQATPDDPETGEPIDEQGVVDIESINLQGWSGTTGNPFLKPMESKQFDLSLEWYFDSSSNMVASLFYKDLKNFFINGAYNRDFTNPVSGVTQTVRVSGPRNGGEGEMQGIELSYTQFYDMLPEPFDGFGIQANYSFIEARGVPNANLDPTNTDGVEEIDNFAFQDDIPLEGQSDHTANFILMYQKNDWDARIAYNWRSEYLLTTKDVITGLPVYTEAAGFLDASVFYNLTDDIKVGFQGVNLANTETVTYMQPDDDLKLGRSWFVNDRRYTFVIRANF